MLVSVAASPARTAENSANHTNLADDCPSTTTSKDEFPAFAVARVTDGDTLVLADNRRVRLIGLNALELRSQDKDDQHWAQAASQALSEVIDGQPVTLVEGRDKQDRHGRTLAHVLVASGDNAAQALIAKGLALAVAVGRNTRCAHQMRDHENRARLERRGIWRNPGNWFVDSPSLRGNERGFHVVEARVQTIGGSSRSPTLLLSNGLTVRLGKTWPDLSSLQHSSAIDNLFGKRVELRGWLSASAGRVRLTLHHPANMRVLDDN